MNEKVNFKNVIRLAGAFVACAIGSGFATGQEVMQFFTGQGPMSVVGTLITTVIFTWCGMVFMKHGYRFKISTPPEVMKTYFGEKLGTIAEIVIQIFLYGVYIIMVAGAGATLSEFFGLPPMVGRIVISACALVTVILGLTKLTDILGGLGTVIIIFAVGTGIYGAISGGLGIHEAGIVASTLDIVKTDGGWLWSSILYPGFNAVVVVILSCCIGEGAESEKEAKLGGMIGGFLFGLAVIIMNLGLLTNITEVFDKSVPTLVLAGRISPIFAVVFSVIICCGIYTTAVPMLWGVVRRFAEDKTKKSAIIATVLAAVGLALGMTDFKVLVNTIYPASGYVGVVLLLLALWRDINGKAKQQSVLESRRDEKLRKGGSGAVVHTSGN